MTITITLGTSEPKIADSKNGPERVIGALRPLPRLSRCHRVTMERALEQC